MRKKGNKNHSVSFKLKVINEIIEKKCSMKTVDKEYSISLYAIHSWVKNYQNGGENLLKDKTGRVKTKKPSGRPKLNETQEQKQIRILLNENKLLKAKNDDLKKLQGLFEKKLKMKKKKK